MPPDSASDRPARFLGAVLAGGAGRRFGRPKGQVRLGGRSLPDRAADTLSGCCAEVVVVSTVPVDTTRRVIPDRPEGIGPVGGLHAALREAEAGGRAGVLVLACDLPLVPVAVLEALAAALGDGTAVAPPRAGGGIEPLCAAYGLRALPGVAAAAATGGGSLHALFEAVGGRAIETAALGAGPDTFLNVNRPDDAERARVLLAGRAAQEVGP